jgi:hypothetical protein
LPAVVFRENDDLMAEVLQVIGIPLGGLPIPRLGFLSKRAGDEDGELIRQDQRRPWRSQRLRR